MEKGEITTLITVDQQSKSVYPEAACKRACEAYDWRSFCRKSFIWYIISSYLGDAKVASGGFSQAAGRSK